MQCSNFEAADAASDQFFENLKNEAIEAGMKQFEQRAHAAAASIVDLEASKHADVLVRRRGPTQLFLRTCGSPAFARELESASALIPARFKP